MINPFQLFESSEIYKVAMLYFSSSRGLAIIGRKTSENGVEVLKYAGEVDPRTGAFTALDYESACKEEQTRVITKEAFEDLVTYIETKIGGEIRMSVIEPELLQSLGLPDHRGALKGYLH